MAENPDQQRVRLMERVRQLEAALRKLLPHAEAERVHMSEYAIEADAKLEPMTAAYWRKRCETLRADIAAARALVGQIEAPAGPPPPLSDAQARMVRILEERSRAELAHDPEAGGWVDVVVVFATWGKESGDARSTTFLTAQASRTYRVLYDLGLVETNPDRSDLIRPKGGVR
jgi:hypothetical protein